MSKYNVGDRVRGVWHAATAEWPVPYTKHNACMAKKAAKGSASNCSNETNESTAEVQTQAHESPNPTTIRYGLPKSHQTGKYENIKDSPLGDRGKTGARWHRERVSLE
jgi:hypothetical protein